MATAAGERLIPFVLVVITAVLGAHAIPVRNRRLTDPFTKAPCPDDPSGLIPVGCPVEMTSYQGALQFVCPYTLIEVCTWFVNSDQPIGSTSDHYPEFHVFNSGLMALVSNYVTGQSDLTLIMPSASLSLEGTEVMCSCQVQGEEQETPTITKTTIADKRGLV